MPAVRIAVMSLTAVWLLCIGTAGAGSAAMERSQWLERGFKPPPPIGTDDVHPRKPFDQDLGRCAPAREVEDCAFQPDTRGRSVPHPRPSDDRPQQ